VRVRKSLLVTAFEPFGESAINPSQLVLERLRPPLGWELRREVLPVETEALPTLLDTLLQEPPSLALALGEARASTAFRVERWARNRLDFGRPDNAGRTIADGQVSPGGRERLPSTLDVATVLETLRELGTEAYFSDDAGGYLCNQLFYSLRHRLPESVPVGFLHLPSLPEQGFGAGLPLEEQVLAVQAVLDALARG
jgi:pyroglutamyl-peptidase